MIHTGNIFKNNNSLISILFLILWGMCPTSDISAFAEEPLRLKIGVLAKRGTQQCLEQWGPTADYLSGKIEGVFFEVIPLSFEAINPAVEKGEVDFVLTNPANYVSLERWYGANRIATLRNRCVETGCIKFGGVIFYHKNRDDIKTIQDLRGKSFMATDEISFGGWIAVRRELQEQGINPHQDFSGLSFGETHDSVVYAVRDGLVEAGCVRTDILEQMAFEGKIELSDFVVIRWSGGDDPDFQFLRSTRLYPEWPMAKLPNAPENLAESITIALLQIPPDSDAALAGHYVGWTIPQNYQLVHECLRYLKLEPYSDLGKITAKDIIEQYGSLLIFAVMVFIGTLAFSGVVLRLNIHLVESRKELAEEVVEHLKTAEALKEAKKIAEEATRAKSEFLANMSHEIRTPMNGVIAAAELAMNELLSPKVGKYVKIILTSANSLLGIINDILDFSKIEAGKLTIESRRFSLDEIIERVVELFLSSASAKRIELLVDIDPTVPRTMKGDSLRLLQILNNLVGNAVKFTEKGGFIIIGAKASDFSDNRFVLNMWVKDSGIGISGDYLKNLFKPFTQENGFDTRRQEGTGLGLSICKRLVEMMHGQIWVESELGKGSTFFFTVRLGMAAQEPDRIFSPPQELRSLHVLVVDDCEENRRIVFNYLKSFGYTVEIAESGKKALTMIENMEKKDTPLDLVLMDRLMPETDGLEISGQIREKSAKPPRIIMMTTFGSDLEPAEAENLGIQAFLIKPVYQSALFDAIMDVFGKSKHKSMIPHSTATTDLTMHMSRLKGFRILAVEDNPTNLEIAVAILERAGIKADTATNGREAVEKISRNRYDAVLMDVQMPEMDGLQATRKIRSDPALIDLPIIAMTAHAMKGDEEKCMAAGMDGYVPKPVDQKRLFEVLWCLLKDRSPVTETKPFPSETETKTEPWVFTGKSFPDKVPGINIRESMKSLNLGPDIYRKILFGFRKNNLDVAESIRKAIMENDTDRILLLAHTLKGSSGNIGAHNLESASRDLEAAVMKHADQSLLDTMAKRVVETLHVVLSSILKLEKSGDSETSGDIFSPDLNNGRFPEALNELANALRRADPEEINHVFNSLEAYAQWEKKSEIKRLIEQYNYQEALAVLTSG